MSQAAQFRAMLKSGKMIVAPGAIDCITGKLIEQAGFAAAYMTGAGTSATLAEPVVAQRLEVKVGAALIDLRSMMVDQHGRAVEYVEMLAPPERLSLRFELGAEQLVPVSKPSKSRRSLS